jgi:hypothetical protein
MLAEQTRLRSDLENVIKDHTSLQDELRGIPASVRKTVISASGVVIVVVLSFFGYLVADLRSHEKTAAHPEALAEMAAVKTKVDGQEKATDKIAKVVQKNNDLLMQMHGQNGNGRSQ